MCNTINTILSSNLFAALIGGGCSLLGTYIVIRCEKKTMAKIAAKLLAEDLKSIRKYFTKETASINLRYSQDWERNVSNCDCLKSTEITDIYDLYDNCYDYNYYYALKEKVGSVNKNDVIRYKELRQLFEKSDNPYNQIISELESKYK